MKIWFGTKNKPKLAQGAAVTIGNFDGVHLGHFSILKTLRREADSLGLPTMAVVFEPQPQEFFSRCAGKVEPYRLSPLRDKLRLLRRTGCLDAVWVMRFNQSFASIPAQVFVDDLLRRDLNTKFLLIGDDFRFGAGRQGDFEMLSQQPDMITERTPSVIVENIRASSTAVREALSHGRLDYAQRLLGHPYTLSGRVKYGAQLGRTIGSPTANIHLPNHRYPLNGVFVVEVEGRFGRRFGVASFGLNPTVSETVVQKLEVHLFDFHGNLYGERLNVNFLHKLRDEKKFNDIETLKQAIYADMDAARNWIES